MLASEACRVFPLALYKTKKFGNLIPMVTVFNYYIYQNSFIGAARVTVVMARGEKARRLCRGGVGTRSV